MIAKLCREAIAVARAQSIASLVTILMISGMIVAVMLTSGRTIGAEAQVLSTIDAAGTRAVTIRAESGAGITSGVIERIQRIDGIEWAGAFSPAVDGRNAVNPDGVPVPVRNLYTADAGHLDITSSDQVPEQLAWVSDEARRVLGMPQGVGGITTPDLTYGVGGTIHIPDYLADLDPVALVPHSQRITDQPVSLIVVIVADPTLIKVVSDAVLSVLAPVDPTRVAVETSAELAQLRGAIGDQLGSFSRGLVLVLVSVTGGLVAVLLFSLVMMRRKDFGRRRALGATRGFIVALLLLQTALLALVGVGVGLAVSVIALAASGDPLPGLEFIGTLGVLATAVSVLSALVPAIVASRREPIRELRVP